MRTSFKIRAKTVKNKISTCGYFMKRMKDNGYIVLKMFSAFGEHDPRRWMVLVDPGRANVFVTCYNNKDFINQVMFEFNDGGNKYPKNFNISTNSIEVIINSLIVRGIEKSDINNPFRKDLNINNDK